MAAQTTNPGTGTNETIPLEDWASIDQLVAEYPQQLTVSMLRWQLRHRYENGMANCCIRAGKKILISKTRYTAWLSTQVGA